MLIPVYDTADEYLDRQFDGTADKRWRIHPFQRNEKTRGDRFGVACRHRRRIARPQALIREGLAVARRGKRRFRENILQRRFSQKGQIAGGQGLKENIFRASERKRGLFFMKFSPFPDGEVSREKSFAER